MSRSLEEIYEKVNSRTINFLSYKPRSTKELEQKITSLLQREVSLSAAEKAKIKNDVLEKLGELNLVDDASYAHDYIMEKINGGSLTSMQKVKSFLIKKGISKDAITDALSLYPKDMEYETALKEGHVKLERLKRNNKDHIKQRLSQYLYGKGYSTETIRTVVDTLIDVK